MWKIVEKKINGGVWFSIESGSTQLSYLMVLSLWRNNQQFREFFIQLLANNSFDAYRWETPAISSLSAKQPFEFVLLNSPSLVRKPDISTFSEHIMKSGSSDVIEIENLGKDARMVVPCDIDPSADYCHLGSFSRSAPITQQHNLWKLVGEVTQKNLSDKPKWLSTAGAGVAWLHVRLDNRPKYYGYTKFRESI